MTPEEQRDFGEWAADFEAPKNFDYYFEFVKEHDQHQPISSDSIPWEFRALITTAQIHCRMKRKLGMK